MKRQLEEETNDSRSADSDSDSVTTGTGVEESNVRSDKSKERNRIHSKLTRLRKRSKNDQMKDRLLELQNEVN
jgi:hypothetical protein